MMRNTTPILGTALTTILVVLTLSAALLAPKDAEARERAWVRGEIRLNVRSGPGTQFRILGGVATGDGLVITRRGDGWIEVQLEDGITGWIPEGYLKAEPPPTVRLAQLEREVVDLRERLDTSTSDAEQLKQGNATLTETDGTQRAEIDRLTLDNTKLRAGARYPELIAGAGILAAGMILGALLHKSSSSRRPMSRIRL